MRSSGGEIVQVEGGHIVRSTGRKDRHSKVYTSKGPRDRRVRLSAHTAIEFYDVQDRLGYDRPSKAVDWLIKKAKPSIDKLAEIPPWNPPIHPDRSQPQQDQEHNMANINEEPSESSAGYNNLIHLQQRQLGGENNQGNHHSAFISPHVVVDTNPIPFFPTTSATGSSNINFQSYPSDIITRTNNPTQDLGLSLHSFQHHPGLIHPWQSQQAAGGEENHAPSNEQQHQTLFAAGSTTTPVGFENHYQRTVTWNSEVTADHINKVGFMQVVNSQPFSASEYSQSGTLHSSFSPSARSNWNDIVMAASSEHHHRSQQQLQVHHQASIFGSRFVSDGLAGFCNIPDRIDQGVEEEEDNGVASNRPSSASTSSQH